MPRSSLVSFAIPLALALAPSVAEATRPCAHSGGPTAVYPGNPNWTADARASASGFISAANPRTGNASLQLGTTGDLFDWAFYLRAAPAGGYGLLSQLDCLAFDWFRESVVSPTSDVPWDAQSPVLRLLINDGGVESELVWEKYYTDASATINDQWIDQDLMGQNFWRVLPGQGYTIAGCLQADPFFPNPLLTYSLSGWSTSSCYTGQAYVAAVSVGVGSAWPREYRGYVDNVRLGFAGQSGFAVNDNFELTPVPEPGTIGLLATGLAGIVGAGLIRRRRQRGQ